MKKSLHIAVILIIAFAFLAAISFLSLEKTLVTNAVTDFSIEESNEANLPPSYTSPYISPIKDQGYHGNCWIFSTLSVLESNLMAMGYINPNSEDGFFDFSEQALTYQLTIKCPDCEGTCTQNVYDSKFYCDDCGTQAFGHNRIMNDGETEGGFEEFIVSYLMSSAGVLLEEEFPYAEYFDVTIPENINEIESLFQITDVVSIEPNIDELKKAVIDYGAITVNGCVDYEKGKRITDPESGVYTFTYGATKHMPSWSGHAMSLVGYDDNYSKDNFSVNRAELLRIFEEYEQITPPKIDFFMNQWGLESYDHFKNMSSQEFSETFEPQNNGAWLIKNSWGTVDGGYDGFVWMSYEDYSLYNLNPDSKAFAFTGIQLKENSSSSRYQLDENGAIFHMPTKEKINSSDFAVANVFQFSDDTFNKVDYVTFSTKNSKGANYELYYTLVKQNGEIESDYDKMALLKSGTILHSGYQTVFFDESIILPKGKGAIVMRIDSSEKDNDAWFGLDTYFLDWYLYSNKTVMIYFPMIGENESFVISNGELFTPFEAYGRDANFSLKIGIIEENGPSNISFGYADYSEVETLLLAVNQSGYNQKSFTEESWKAYVEALANLENLQSMQDLSYSEQQLLNTAIGELNAAIEKLEEKKNLDGIFAVSLTLAIVVIVILLGVISLKKKVRK